jgi:hypothetical protein
MASKNQISKVVNGRGIWKDLKGNSMHYIMVTIWEGHWDNIPHNETYYTSRVIRPSRASELVDYTPTIFVKLNEDTREIEKAWQGEVHSIRRKGNRVYFTVDINSELADVHPYKGLPIGWHVRHVIAEPESDLTFHPPFFRTIRETGSWQEFEDLTFYLLKILGIHTIYKFEKQRGRADGFFKFGNLAVIYDSTLESNFEAEKADQIENFRRQLKSGFIDIPEYPAKEEFPGHDKQVWIVTRGESRLIGKFNGILVKEICVGDLINIYEYRMKKILSGRDLEDKLKRIGQTK